MGCSLGPLIFSMEAAVLWAVGRSPGFSLSRLSRALGMNYIRLRGCVMRLYGAGLLRVEASERAFRVYLTKEGLEALDRVGAALSAKDARAKIQFKGLENALLKKARDFANFLGGGGALKALLRGWVWGI